MDALFEKTIVRCFPGCQVVQNVVRRELLNPKNFEDRPEVDRLQFMVIKSKMRKELITDGTDLKSMYIYKLIFKEVVAELADFEEEKPIWKPSENRNAVELLISSTVNKFKSVFQRKTESVADVNTTQVNEPIQNDPTSEEQPIELEEDKNRRAERLMVRSDGELMFAILSYKITRFFSGHLQLIVTQYTLRIRINSKYVAEIPHRKGKTYDTFWADKFLKMIMSRYAMNVTIELDGEALPDRKIDFDYMAGFINKKIIDKLPRGIPAEPWNQYITEDRPVYFRWGDMIRDEDIFVANFESYTSYSQHPFPDPDLQFWGYMKDE